MTVNEGYGPGGGRRVVICAVESEGGESGDRLRFEFHVEVVDHGKQKDMVEGEHNQQARPL